MSKHGPNQLETLPETSDRNWGYILLIAGSQAGLPRTAAGMDALVEAYDVLEETPSAITLARSIGQYLTDDARRGIDTNY